MMCRVYGVTRAGFYAWRSRGLSLRAQENAALVQQITQIHQASRRLYGSPRIHHELKTNGVCVGENRVARLMRNHGIRARVATLRYTVPNMKRFFGSLPNRQHEHPAAEPNQVWVGDITYLKVGAIYRYLAVVMDRCSRRIVGWAFGRQKNVVLTLRALNHAVGNRRPPPGLIFHTDRGIEYAANAFRERLAELNITQSMNRPGKVTDNAFMESCFSRLKAELLQDGIFETIEDAHTEIFEYLEMYYNTRRLHSSLNYQSPMSYEKKYYYCLTEENFVSA